MFNSIKGKNKTPILFFAIFFIIISLVFSNTYTKKSTDTISNSYLNFENIKEYDFDGDGENDKISIISTNTTYSIKIKNSIGDTLLKSNEFDYSLLDISPSCVINILYIDLNRNKIPELIISGLKNNKPTFYIFQWIDNTFKEVLFSQNNILGILDYNNSRTPKIYTTLSTKGDESTSAYILNSNTIKDITFSTPKIPSLGIIQTLIDLIQFEYEIDDAPGIFTPYIPSEELGLLWNLDKLTYHYTFQKAYFYDISWDEFGKTTALYWILSFEKSNFIDSTKKAEEVILYVKTEIDELNQYKISSIINFKN